MERVEADAVDQLGRQRRGSDPPTVEVVIRFTGDPPLRDLVAELSEIQGVQSAVVFEDSHNDEI